jgi:hypothetical protein
LATKEFNTFLEDFFKTRTLSPTPTGWYAMLEKAEVGGSVVVNKPVTLTCFQAPL